jgi:hypothetical protein
MLIGLITFIPGLQSRFQKYNLGINYFLTLIATLVGVLLAITITNFEESQKEKSDVIKLLNASIESVDTSYDYTDELLQYETTLKDNDLRKVDFFIKNPAPYPDYLDTFIMQNIVSKNLSEPVLSDLNALLINLKVSKRKSIPLYLKFLKQTIKTLELEILYQKGLLTNLQLESNLDMLEKATLKVINDE